MFPVPIQMAGGPDPPPEEEVATFFWVDDRGEIAKTIESVPIRNGVAVYNGEPLPHGAHWAITIHDVGGLPIFRSGPLAQLPGPASDFTLGSQIRVFRLSSGAFFGIDSPDGAPELVRQRLNSLPEPFRVDGVKFSSPTTRFRYRRESRRLCGGARSGNCRRRYQRAQRGRHTDRRGAACAFWSRHSGGARIGDPDRGNPDGFGSANERRGERRGYHRGRDCHRQRALIPLRRAAIIVAFDSPWSRTKARAPALFSVAS